MITLDRLEKIPENISVSYLPESKSLSQRILGKGLNYYTQSYIHNIHVFEDETIRVVAKCWRSMRKNENPHKLHIEIGEEKLLESFCTCKAGYEFHFNFSIHTNYYLWHNTSTCIYLWGLNFVCTHVYFVYQHISSLTPFFAPDTWISYVFFPGWMVIAHILLAY